MMWRGKFVSGHRAPLLRMGVADAAIVAMSEADYLAYQRAVASGKLGATRGGSLLTEVRLTDETTWKRQGTLDFVDNTVDRGAGTIRARATPVFYVVVRNLFGRRRAGADAMQQPKRLEML